ncbi:hypothetical protein Pan258_38450 [Symmachiella dynata]|uniref:hypothetical protein n=1 Tax=Symmachiella dynata TaxID=2527995 RepID=UPI0011892663|nr:hypothetical protein [Symmachiella dynata]QDT49790.1 hypothetical protein Pan258_38450 [Symmachiella dynata]
MKYIYWAIAGLILIASYPLAVGPYAWLVQSRQLSVESFHKIDPVFYPLEKYSRDHEMVGALYGSYLKLWLSDDDFVAFRLKQMCWRFLPTYTPKGTIEE